MQHCLSLTSNQISCSSSRSSSIPPLRHLAHLSPLSASKTVITWLLWVSSRQQVKARSNGCLLGAARVDPKGLYFILDMTVSRVSITVSRTREQRYGIDFFLLARGCKYLDELWLGDESSVECSINTKSYFLIWSLQSCHIGDKEF